ncbi:TetR/AcrR family transcriptional regulator [Inediibacterium massiliense]|uniref:TetR/AcrR family transcriptional regulator n=1 Tax=Inediibacterium massiliense TaxID=1658111 RepID=UPI0006B4D74B|nr:TetR/AcrR family transcriptional regulator [Inediibacterium massiliense]
MSNLNKKQIMIIQSAMKVFCKDGFHKAKVSTIASEAGIGKGTIYEYFKNKQDLFLKMIQYYTDVYFRNLVTSMKNEESVIEKLRIYIVLEEECMKKFGDLAHIFIHESQYIGVEITKIMQRQREATVQFIATIIEEGIHKNLFRNIDPYLSSLIFIGSVHQILVSKFCMKDNFAKQIELTNLYDALLNGIKNPSVDLSISLENKKKIETK